MSGELARAAAGDRLAWERIVESYAGLVWSVARQHGLTGADAGDVCQTVWLRLVENIDRIADPSRLGGWLATTGSRESLRVLARAKRQVPVADTGPLLSGRASDLPPPDAGLLRGERVEEVRAALGHLPERCQRLLELLMQDPPPSYESISSTLGMPVGSIGPTRARCLRRLQHLLDETELPPP
ncbi:MAG: RNA polymerase sigma factor [Mycobacteriales bacterium]